MVFSLGSTLHVGLHYQLALLPYKADLKVSLQMHLFNVGENITLYLVLRPKTKFALANTNFLFQKAILMLEKKEKNKNHISGQKKRNCLLKISMCVCVCVCVCVMS